MISPVKNNNTKLNEDVTVDQPSYSLDFEVSILGIPVSSYLKIFSSKLILLESLKELNPTRINKADLGIGFLNLSSKLHPVVFKQCSYIVQVFKILFKKQSLIKIEEYYSSPRRVNAITPYLEIGDFYTESSKSNFSFLRYDS